MIKKTLIIGFALSGRASANLLLQQGKEIIAVDQKSEIYLNHPAVRGLQLQSDQRAVDFDNIEQVILSPGIPLNHPLVRQAMEKGIEIIGEIELAARFLQNPMIGITGTNGKTTVVKLIEHVLQSANIAARAVGNVGFCLASYVSQCIPKEILVVELSSYQLETLKKKCLDAAVILNITPDHLDRYQSMEDYAYAKCSIQKYLKDPRNLWISQSVAKDYGYMFECFHEWEDFLPSAIESISPMRCIQLGMPERQNILPAYAVCKHFGMTDEQFLEGIKTFRKQKHRIEYISEWNKIAFYNDSKATNVDAVIHAVQILNGSIILLAGGVHKGSSYRPWVLTFQKKVARIIAFGAAAQMIEKDLKNDICVHVVETLQQALCLAMQYAKENMNVLLSPGCSSFDQFCNYEHRGNEFKRMIEEKIWIEKKPSLPLS